jgi:hypothetical protein
VGIRIEGDSIVTRGFAGDIARWSLPTPAAVIEACGLSVKLRPPRTSLALSFPGEETNLKLVVRRESLRVLAGVELTRILGGDAILLFESDLKHCTQAASPAEGTTGS